MSLESAVDPEKFDKARGRHDGFGHFWRVLAKRQTAMTMGKGVRQYGPRRSGVPWNWRVQFKVASAFSSASYSICD